MNAPDGNRRALQLAIVFVAALAAARAVSAFLPFLLDSALYTDDAAQHIWWTYRYADAELYPDDLAATYFSRYSSSPPGIAAIFATLAPHIDAQRLSELLPFLLAIPVALFAFLLGWRVGGLPGAVLAPALIFMTYTIRQLEGGLARSFMLPLLLFGIWAAWGRHCVWLGLAFLAAAFFYPPAAVNVGLFAGLVFALDLQRTRKLPAGWPWLLGLGLIALAIVAATQLQPAPDGIGSHVSRTEARTMPEFADGGRCELFVASWSDFLFTNQRAGLGIPPVRAAIGLLAGLIALWIWPRAVPREAWLLFATALLAFALAHATLFSLYLPSRYTRTALPVFAALWAAAVVPQLLRSVSTRPRLGALALWLMRPRVIAITAVILLVALWIAAGSRVVRMNRKEPPAGLLETMAFLESLPKDTLVAAHPFDADAVGMLARRSVLVCAETALPYHVDYYQTMKARTIDALTACYATRWQDVEMLHERYGVDVFIVNRRNYEIKGLARFLRPFDEAGLAAFERGQQEGFTLLAPPEARVLFSFASYSVVRL